MGYQIEGTFPMESQTLTSFDGFFMCTPEIGAEAAYLLSTMEDVHMRSKHGSNDLYEMVYLLRDYFNGKISVVDIIKTLLGPEWQEDLYTQEEYLKRCMPDEEEDSEDSDDEV